MSNRGFDFNNMRQSFNRAFEDALNFASQGALKLPVDMIDTPKAILILSVPLLNVVPESLDISVSGEYLTIRGETAPDDEYPKSAYLRRERRYGAFERKISIPVPIKADEARAELLKNGALRVSLPKTIPMEPTVINVVSEEGSSDADENAEYPASQPAPPQDTL